MVFSTMKLLMIFLSLFGFSMAKKAITFETIEVTYFNPKYGTGNLYSNKYNSTTFLINGSLNTTRDFPRDAVLIIDIYKLSDNTYKKTALSMKKTICQFLEGPEMKMMWSSYLEERFHRPEKCPFSAGYYPARDIDPNRLIANELFNFIPQWDIKVEVAIKSKSEQILQMTIRFRVIDIY